LREHRSTDGSRGRRPERCAFPLSSVEIALRYLAPRRRFERQVRAELRRKGFSREETDAAIARVKELGLIDDAETARAWIKDRLRFGPKGKGLLRAQLLRNGVAPAVADDALDDVLKESPEIETAVAVLKRMASRRGRTSENVLRRRMWSALARRGFDRDTTREAIAQVLGEDESE
jgi:regulatory protein